MIFFELNLYGVKLVKNYIYNQKTISYYGKTFQHLVKYMTYTLNVFTEQIKKKHHLVCANKVWKMCKLDEYD